MRCAICPNLKKPQALALAINVRDFLKARQVAVVCSDEAAKLMEVPALSTVKSEEVNFVISLGGDGSLLNFIHTYPQIEAPCLGVNIGTLGFLADVPIANLYPALEEFLSGAYTIQNRLMLSGKTEKEKVCYAVNEMVVHRGENHTLVDLAIFVDGHYLNTFSADGVIVATPSGSTAYSLSAGGPIITPDLEALVITPICPHTISNRPIVLPPTCEITIQYLSDLRPVQVSFDGICRISLRPNESFRIVRASRNFSLVTLKSVDYFSTLRTKLAWTGTLKI